MKYLDEFRDAAAARRLVSDIRRNATRRWTIMEVCGGQTHSLLRYGIEDELTEIVELLHGPGCPVCVTTHGAIDFACELAQMPGVTLASFGDMLRVPGSQRSLLDVRAAGGSVRSVYSPLDAVTIARQNADRQVVFFAVGFETTAPATALAVLQAHRLSISNFTLLAAHVRVQPAMERIVSAADNRVQGFLAAGHVCTVVGCRHFASFIEQYRVPVVVTGFEPVDLLSGIRECVHQLEENQASMSNQYTRTVQEEGNRTAQDLIGQVYEACDRPWRGLGVIPAGGLRLREQWADYDAELQFKRDQVVAMEKSDCLSGDVLIGRIKPPQCPHFGTRCTPDNPLGAPMVSSEGACAAYFRYRQVALPQALRTSS